MTTEQTLSAGSVDLPAQRHGLKPVPDPRRT